MNKLILFLMLIMGVFSPLINAWNLIIQDYKSTTQTSEMYYFDVNVNQIKFQRLYNGQSSNSGVSPNGTYFWSGLSNVKSYGGSQGYRTIQQINNDFKNDIEILDSFYRNAIQLTLNWFYNPNSFSYNKHIEYTNYQILYDENGLAVESIVGGVWAGLYDDNEKYQSGDLYDNLGRLQYYNGEPATPVDSFYVWLARFTHRIVGEVFQELSRTMIFGTILCIVLVLAMLYFCMENFLFIRPRRRSRPYYLYGEDGSRHTFRQVELDGKNYARLNPEWAQRRREENERARAGR